MKGWGYSRLELEVVTVEVERKRGKRSKGADGAISSEALGCSEGREEVNCCFNKRLRISIHHPQLL